MFHATIAGTASIIARQCASHTSLLTSVLEASLNIQKGGVLKLPSNVSFEDASLIEPLACCIRGLDRADSDSAERILVLGCGPVGQMHIKILSLKGKNIVAADINSKRLEMAQMFGASHTFESDSRLKE